MIYAGFGLHLRSFVTKTKPKSSNAKSPTKAPAERVVKYIRRQTRRYMGQSPPVSHHLSLKRGRPKAEDVAQIEEAVLTTALSLFLQDDLEAVSMERVAAAVGISRTTLYKRYSTSEDIVQAMVRYTITSWYERTYDVLSIVSDAIEALLRDRLAAIANRLVDPVFRDLQRLVLADVGRFPELAAIMHEYGYQNAIRLLAADIRNVAARTGN